MGPDSATSCHCCKAESQRPRPGSILCLGIPLLDMCFFGDKQFLSEYGLNANGCLVPEIERFKKIYQALKARYKAEYHLPGGSCQNVARTVQWLLGEHPGTVTYMGAVGNDAKGAILKQKTKEAGVNVLYQTATDGTPTGCCLVILNDKDRSLVAAEGAGARFNCDHLQSNWDAVESAKFVYVEGFFLPYCFDAVTTLAKHVAQHHEKRFLLNLSAEYVTVACKKQLVELMPYVDVLIGNYDENRNPICMTISSILLNFLHIQVSLAKQLGFKTSGGGNNAKEIAKMVSAMTKIRREISRIVIVTNGAHPVNYATSRDDAFTQELPLLGRDFIVDTSGAGDAFVGGILAQMIRGKNLTDCIRSGLNTAAIVIQQMGCTFPNERPSLDELCQ